MNQEQWRASMGRGLEPWAHSPGSFHEVTDSSWSILSGAASADVNVVLVWGEGADEVASAMTGLTTRGLPGLVMLADAAKKSGTAAPEGWQHVGEMPIMTVSLADADTASDPRVRVAGPQDQAMVNALLSEGFGMTTEIAGVCTKVLSHPSDSMQIWLLEDEGVPVCTVIGTFAGDTFSIWCMSTPQRFARRGFGRAMLATVLQEARDRGARTGLLGATPAGYPLYEASGWTTFETWDIYTNAMSVQFH